MRCNSRWKNVIHVSFMGKQKSRKSLGPWLRPHISEGIVPMRGLAPLFANLYLQPVPAFFSYSRSRPKRPLTSSDSLACFASSSPFRCSCCTHSTSSVLCLPCVRGLSVHSLHNTHSPFGECYLTAFAFFLLTTRLCTFFSDISDFAPVTQLRI